MKQHAASHVDHALTPAQLRFLLDRFADRSAFFIETLTLPPDLGTVPCGLYGPIVGDPPIGDPEVTYARRGDRAWDSRLIALPSRPQHAVTVITGPHDEKCTSCDGAGSSFSMTLADSGHGDGYTTCAQCHGAKVLKHACILYTAFGGPLAPQEPGDPGCKDPTASAAFWRDHALSR